MGMRIKNIFFGAAILVLAFSFRCKAEGTNFINSVFDLKKYDLSIVGSGRTFPQGGTVSATAGRGFLFWKSGKESESIQLGNLFYGFVRPSVTLATAGTYNSASAQIEIYPISFIGFRAGTELTNNSKDYKDFNCNTLNCQGGFTREFVEADMALKYKKFFYLAKAGSWSVNQDGNPNQDFVQINSGLPAQSDGDTVVMSQNIIGMQVKKNWALSLLHERMEMKDSGNSGKTTTVNLTKRQKEWIYTAGIGKHESDVNESGLTVLFKIEFVKNPKRFNLY